MTVPARRYLELAERRIEFVELPGSEPAIVLLHEGLGSVGLWRRWPRLVQEATGRRVVAYSRFGHGHSDPPPNPRTPAFFREEALDVLPPLLEELEIEAPILFGHSDGASIALIYAAHHRVSGLVLLAPHVFVEERTVRAIAETRAQYREGDLRDRMSRHHRDPDVTFWGWCDVWLDPAFSTWTLTPEIRHLSAPVLLVQGAEDPYGSLEQLDRIEAGAGGSVERLLVAGGHSPHREAEAEVLRALAAFTRPLRDSAPHAVPEDSNSSRSL
jgi:pimeloyl-ACP methyl ester carboxylesterase